MSNQTKLKPIVFLAVLVFAVVAMSGSAAAMQFSLGKDTSLDVDTTLTYAAGWRVKDPEKSKLGKYNPAAANADDGNENFDQWDMINNKITAIMDIDLRHKDFGIFLRPKAFYDRAYMTDNANDSPATNNNLAAGAINDTDEFDGEAEDIHGQNVELLDIFAYANFDVAGRNVSLRVGRQVISWGESLFLQGGIASSQTALDVSAANTPGYELKELFLPSEAVYLQTDLTDTLSLGAYYQWRWDKYVLNESGSFFSTTDMLDDAGYAILHPLVPTGIRRISDDDPSDSGQFGVSLTYIADWLVGTEFGLYYLNYHEKTPQLVMAIPNYYLTYAEDVKLYAVSVSSMIGATNVSGEITYRKDYPITMATGAVQDGNVVQAQVSWLYYWGNPLHFIDQIKIQGEVGYNKVMGVEGSDLSADKSAWGVNIKLIPNWTAILTALDLEMPITYNARPDGNSSLGGTFTEGADSASIGLDFTYKNVYKFGIKYADNFNKKRNAVSDRDNISVTFKYSF